MRTIEGRRGLSNLKGNKYGHWNNVSGSDRLSPDPGDASRRIFDGVANVRCKFSRQRLKAADPVFAMGSCFAREIEARLVQIGGAVCSLDERVRRPEFKTTDGRVSTTFLHRFTPQSMLQEFRAAFGEEPAWSDTALIFEKRRAWPLGGGGAPEAEDFNYAVLPGLDARLEAVTMRRALAQALVRRVTEARLVILTLGLNEAWFHKPSGLYVNALTAGGLARRGDDFELHVADSGEVTAQLEAIYALLARRLQPDFDLVLTVSPVPLTATFQAMDVVVANMESKSTLRAAAGAFADGRKTVHYFPSYEMALYSDPSLAWREDRLHVSGKLIRRIVDSFTGAFYEEGAFNPAAATG